MAFNESFDFLYTGHLDGTISMFNISFEERKGKQIRQMIGKKKVRQQKALIEQCRELAWDNKKAELIAANENGNITIWDAMKGEAILVFDAHFDALTKMYWDENRRLLLTGSKDKTIKVAQTGSNKACRYGNSQRNG